MGAILLMQCLSCPFPQRQSRISSRTNAHLSGFDVIHRRPAQALLCVKVHGVQILPLAQLNLDLRGFLFHPRRVPHAESDERFVGTQQGLGEGVAPVDAQSGTSNLHPCVDIGHHGQFAGEDFGQQEVDALDALPLKLVLDQGERMWVALSPERAQDDAPCACLLRSEDRRPP